MKGVSFLPKDSTAKIVLLLSVLFFIFAKWYPIINTFLLSFKEATFFNESWIGLENYRKLFSEDQISLQTFWNTLKFALMVVPATAIIGLALALAGGFFLWGLVYCKINATPKLIVRTVTKDVSRYIERPSIEVVETVVEKKVIEEVPVIEYVSKQKRFAGISEKTLIEIQEQIDIDWEKMSAELKCQEEYSK